MKIAIGSVGLLATVLLVGCGGGGVTAEAACKKIEAAGIAKGCKEVKPEGLNARAASKWDGELVAVPGKMVGAMSFTDDEGFQATTKAFEGAAMLAGPHRYGNAKARIFVQANSGLSLEEGKKLKALVEGL